MGDRVATARSSSPSATLSQNNKRSSATDSEDVRYSHYYSDAVYQYRHVIISVRLLKYLHRGHLMSEQEWRALGITMSKGWQHYHVYLREPNVLLFRRPIQAGAKNPTYCARESGNLVDLASPPRNTPS